MTANNPRASAGFIPWLAVLVAAAVAGVTQIPFFLGEWWTPEGTVFDGLVGMTDDQNMYFSFIRQGTEGHWLFVNRLTYLDHQPVLLNVEWFAVGRLIDWLNGADRWAYAIWRVLGVCLLISGFWLLAGAVGLTWFQKRMALWMFAFGGGFGWIFLVLERSGFIQQIPSAMLDLSDAIHPFSHMFVNPHLSVSHGLSLLFLGAFAAGEQTGKPQWYAIAAGFAVVHGLIRPYDLILIWGVLPLFILLERTVSGASSWRKAVFRLLPLLATLPVFGYLLALFQFHPVLKYWASQGNVRSIGLHWHFLSFGLAGLLCLTRLVLARQYPLKSSSERLLAVWIAAVLFLIYGKMLPALGFIPFAPVFGLTLPSVIVILGACLLSGLQNAWRGGPAWVRTSLLATLVVVNSLGSAIWVLKISHNLAHFPDHYIAGTEHAAHAWLEKHVCPSDVVLSTLATGNRMAKYVSCRFVLGHWSVTPHVKELTASVERFYGGVLTDQDAATLLNQLRVRWIYLGPRERDLGMVDFGNLPGVSRQYANGDVQVFSFEPAGKSE